MKITKQYDHKNALALLKSEHPNLLESVIQKVESISIAQHKTKATKEAGARFTAGQLLYSPIAMNKSLAAALSVDGWRSSRITLESPDGTHIGYREMDGLKDKVGLEIQFGKYSFMGYDILGKFPIFANRGIIEVGIEIVPVKALAQQMSSGVSYFEQITADLHARGAADLDVPTVILGLGFKNPQVDGMNTLLNVIGPDSEDE